MRNLIKIFYIFSVIISTNIYLLADEVQIKGDNLKIIEKEKRYVLSGNVSAMGDDFLIFADTLEFLSLKEKDSIKGDFYILNSSILARCSYIEVLKDLDIKRFYNLNGLVLKLNIEPHHYISYKKEQLFDLFEYRMRLKGAYLRQVGDERFYGRDVNYTICDCKENNTWELSSRDVYIEKNGFLLSLSNVVYLYGIPSFYIPAILFPVGERRSGFLLPELGFNSTTGYSLKNAYYQTLGVSMDATLYLTMMSRRGEMYSLEFRYRPFNNLYGNMMLSFVRDNTDSPFDRRFNIKNEHRLEYNNELIFALNTNIVSDTSYMNDFLFDFWDRNAEYTISRFYGGYNKSPFLLRLEFDFFQNFKQIQRLKEFNLFSDTGLAESHRLPYLELNILPRDIFLNTDVGFDIQYVNYYSLSYDYKKFSYFQTPLIIENDKRTLLSFKRYSFELPIHNYQRIMDFLNLNQDLSSILRIYQLPNTSYNLTTTVYNLRIDLELYKRYSSVVHIIKPEIEYKDLFYLEYTKDWQLYYGRTVIKDEVDNYLRSRYILLHFKNFLLKNSGNEIFRVDIAQGYYKISSTTPTPLVFNSGVNLNYLRLDYDLFYYFYGSVHYFDASGKITISDFRGDSVFVRYQKVRNYLENPFVIYNEDFNYFQPAYYREPLEDISGNINVSISRELSIGYFNTYSIENKRLLFHGGGIYYHSRCHCLNANLTFVMYDWYEFPAFITTFNLGGNI
ncbi:MAG: LPS-assembly protein LptD [Myxococcota bacterium]